jgi:hypothetical protein
MRHNQRLAKEAVVFRDTSWSILSKKRREKDEGE